MERKKQDFNRPVLAGRHSQATASELQRYVELQCILSRNESVFENGSTSVPFVHQISSAANHRINDIFEDRSSPSVESASTQNGYFQCNNHDEKRFAGTSAESKNARNFSTGPKDIKTLEYFMRRQNSEHESEPESIVVEKTLYIDSGQGSLVETMENPQLPWPPPPLPNPPSDSWLCRALPFISSRNQSSQSH